VVTVRVAVAEAETRWSVVELGPADVGELWTEHPPTTTATTTLPVTARSMARILNDGPPRVTDGHDGTANDLTRG
jgi:hypothetical protein